MTIADGPLSVVKVGGSLVSDPDRLRAVLASLADGAEGRAVIVPGGGPFADAVRASQASLGYSDALAHRLALDAMGQTAEVFSELEPRLAIVRSIEAARAHDGVGLWDPVGLRDGHPDIPETWDVTSDSLALWLAGALGAARCVLVKSAACSANVSPDDLVRLGLVDRGFPDFRRYFPGEIVLRGPNAPFHPDTLPEATERSGCLETEFEGSQRSLRLSYEARQCLSSRDEDETRMSGSLARGHAA
ncbi:aspartokinase-like uncharacterized kinase [Methylobacterium brachythecii]|uniref:Aspartokinase-like uncharacterized kinase n=1 Tax=Methylobacterium brachythecii TaxID=1176177 RepID=A0A7W6F6N6_9HYPH|nr:aspartokinase-like uncharacterized kinase [Methylobacterium brachythecii]GLS42461.1 hypothetical protein GCM10007884_04460 [Methylobacterium brachythecii]